MRQGEQSQRVVRISLANLRRELRYCLAAQSGGNRRSSTPVMWGMCYAVCSGPRLA